MMQDETDLLPFVSVVTPFYNTEAYLAECIESVIFQTYENWEYVLVNNCSTDGSLQIAEQYARQDPRIRIVNNSIFLSQVENYNHALRHISPDSRYCKIVQADDWIFPNCLTEMVKTAEAHPTVGIVGAYWLLGSQLKGDGLPYPSTFTSGREMCRWHLLRHPDVYVFGTATSLLVRSDLVRSKDPFYDNASILEDLDICYELLKTSDFGFVHQVLTYSRVDEASITGKIRDFSPYILHALIALKKHGPEYLDPGEYQRLLKSINGRYYMLLADRVLKGRNREFWAYHKLGLGEIGFKLDRVKLCKYVTREMMGLLSRPRAAARTIARCFRRSTQA